MMAVSPMASEAPFSFMIELFNIPADGRRYLGPSRSFVTIRHHDDDFLLENLNFECSFRVAYL